MSADDRSDMLFAAAAPTVPGHVPGHAPALAPVGTTVLGGSSEAGPPTSPASPLLYEGSQIQLWGESEFSIAALRLPSVVPTSKSR
jgi:hypothetical protein